MTTCQRCGAAVVLLWTRNGLQVAADAATVAPDDTELGQSGGQVTHRCPSPDNKGRLKMLDHLKAYLLGVFEARSDWTTHYEGDLIETYDHGRNLGRWFLRLD